jgi:tRNA-specific 2-thiouridylase
VDRWGTDGLELRFENPALAVVPGQYAVLYEGERVLGGGAIECALADEAAAPSTSATNLETVSAP